MAPHSDAAQLANTAAAGPTASDPSPAAIRRACAPTSCSGTDPISRSAAHTVSRAYSTAASAPWISTSTLASAASLSPEGREARRRSRRAVRCTSCCWWWDSASVARATARRRRARSPAEEIRAAQGLPAGGGGMPTTPAVVRGTSGDASCSSSSNLCCTTRRRTSCLVRKEPSAASSSCARATAACRWRRTSAALALASSPHRSSSCRASSRAASAWRTRPSARWCWTARAWAVSLIACSIAPRRRAGASSDGGEGHRRARSWAARSACWSLATTSIAASFSEHFFSATLASSSAASGSCLMGLAVRTALFAAFSLSSPFMRGMGILEFALCCPLVIAATRASSLAQFEQDNVRFTTGLFVMSFALAAYVSVATVSPMSRSSGDTHATIVVREFPPRACCSMRVSLDSRKGTWACLSLSAVITLPSTNSPWLILMAWVSCSPSAPDLLIFSDPARSTKWKLAVKDAELPSTPCCVTSAVNRAWDRDDASFIRVAEVARAAEPIASRRSASSSSRTSTETGSELLQPIRSRTSSRCLVPAELTISRYDTRILAGFSAAREKIVRIALGKAPAGASVLGPPVPMVKVLPLPVWP
mmetsp:Transcript_12786/g.31824  ORF Transcript_12786/g.31824 Transcript_12786/m.31824 type:complete len:593 (-) Transcript_12786:286-2064(-)